MSFSTENDGVDDHSGETLLFAIKSEQISVPNNQLPPQRFECRAGAKDCQTLSISCRGLALGWQKAKPDAGVVDLHAARDWICTPLPPPRSKTF